MSVDDLNITDNLGRDAFHWYDFKSLDEFLGQEFMDYFASRGRESEISLSHIFNRLYEAIVNRSLREEGLSTVRSQYNHLLKLQDVYERLQLGSEVFIQKIDRKIKELKPQARTNI